MDYITFMQCIKAILLFIIILETLAIVGVVARVAKIRLNCYFLALYSFLIVLFTILKGWL
jgi:hypothetical protein